MKGYVLATVSLMIFVVLYNPISLAGERVYTFDDMKAWEVISGKWEVKGGEFYSTGSTSNMIAAALLKEEEGVRTEDLDYVSVRAYDLGTGEWQNIFILFGYDKNEPQYYLGGPFVGGAQEWRIEPVDTKTNDRGSKVAAQGDTLSPEKWYIIKIVFDGDTAILYGAEEGKKLEERTRHTFPKGRPKGRVGLGGSNCENKFDDFTVAGPTITSPVQPHDKLASLWGKLKRIR